MTTEAWPDRAIVKFYMRVDEKAALQAAVEHHPLKGMKTPNRGRRSATLRMLALKFVEECMEESGDLNLDISTQCVVSESLDRNRETLDSLR